MTKTLLVGWDGADWNIARPLMAAGEMPVLSRLVAEGSAGDLTSFAPFLSPMVWTTIATGHHPDRHGVHGFAEVDPKTGNTRAVGTAGRRTKALWNILSEQGGTAGVIGWMGSFPADVVHGACVSDLFGHAPNDPTQPWPVPAGSVYPPQLAADLADLRLRPTEVDPRLLGLFLPDVGSATPELFADPLVRSLLHRLAQLYTVQNAAITVVSDAQPDLTAVYFHFLDLICHEFVTFHPPRHPRVNTAASQRYHYVVRAAYRLQDLLLGDLLQHCAPGTSVMLVSDHGFKTGAERPSRLPTHDATLADWHRREGIVVAHGPGIRAGKLGLVKPQDIAPTLLAWQGLAPGADMPGRVLNELFLHAPEPASVASWETEPARVAPPSVAPMPVEDDASARLTRRFIELGYLDPSTIKGPLGGQKVDDENEFTLGVALRDLGRRSEALPHLQRAALRQPESTKRAVELGSCLLDLELTDEAEAALQPLFDHGTETAQALLLRIQLLIVRRAFVATSPLLEALAATEFAPLVPGLRRLILLRSGQFEPARVAFTEEITRGGDRIMPLLGLAQACLWTGRYAEVLDACRRVLALDPQSTDAQTLADEARACQTARRSSPQPAPFDLLTAVACLRDADRTAYHDRAADFYAKRDAGRVLLSQQRHPLLIVSGAPRSGTSLMMRMLAMAGVPVFTDGVRAADESNPLGYFEWEAVKQLSRTPEILENVAGKALKVVSPLLPELPTNRTYDVIFMRRDADAILRSQEAMIDQEGREQGPGLLSRDELETHIEATLEHVRQRPEMRLIEINYDTLLAEPAIETARLVQFLGEKRIKRPAALAAAIRRDLCHHPATAELCGVSSND